MPKLTDGMTNTKILEYAKDQRFLSGLQRQTLFLMQMHLQRKPCPNCGEPHNLPETAGVTDIDEYDFGGSDKAKREHPDHIGPCRKCKRTLVYRLPMISGDWYWALLPSEAEVNRDEEGPPARPRRRR